MTGGVDKSKGTMRVHLVDGTYELFRHFFGQPPRTGDDGAEIGAVRGVLSSVVAMLGDGATHVGVATDHVIESFRTAHFDGMAHVPSYTSWVLDCDMVPAYRYHRRVLRLLHWHCPPRLWHLKTPVHMLSLEALDAVYPDARFLWTHRRPAEVIGSVCSLVDYIRSWVSDDGDPARLGPQQVALWSEALRRAMVFRDTVGEQRFADVSFSSLNADPVTTVTDAYGHLGLDLSAEAARRMTTWSSANTQGTHGRHDYSLEDFGLIADAVDDAFRFYTDRYADHVAAGDGRTR